MNAMYRLAVDDIPTRAIESVRHDIIGSGRIEP